MYFLLTLSISLTIALMKVTVRLYKNKDFK